jgi:hypothetical protein
VLSRAEYEELDESLPLRNAAAHGLQTDLPGPEQIQLLIDATRRMLETTFTVTTETVARPAAALPSTSKETRPQAK